MKPFHGKVRLLPHVGGSLATLARKTPHRPIGLTDKRQRGLIAEQAGFDHAQALLQRVMERSRGVCAWGSCSCASTIKLPESV